MTAPRRHHYVPRFYLEFFTSPDGHFWVYDKAGGPPRKQSPVNTAVQKDYYSFRDKKGDPSPELEQALSEIESRAKPILEKWQRRSAAPEDSEFPVIAQFLALLHVRVPRNVELAREFMHAIVVEEHEKLIQDPQKFKEIWEQFQKESNRTEEVDVDGLREFAQGHGKTFEIKVNEKAALAASLELEATVTAYLLQMNWRRMFAPSGETFITSDAPVTIFAPWPNGKAVFGAGLGLPGCEISFPLSPSTAMWIAHKEAPGFRRASQFVREMNRRTAYGAERFLISPFESKRVQRLADEFSWTHGHTKIDREEFLARYRSISREAEPG